MATSDTVIEVDSSHEGQSDYESGYGSDTTSLASAVQQYFFENGRRYQAYFGPEKSLMPNDEIEQDRLDIHHEIMVLIAGKKLYHAPLENPHRILDIGTGTGIWAIDCAEAHPESEVIGVDLSPIQPQWVPANCRFEVDDVEKAWTWQPNSFDFIHVRNVRHMIQDWPLFISQAYQTLKPGGYIQLAELGAVPYSDDGSMPADWPPKKFLNLFCVAMEKINRPAPTAEALAASLSEQSFEDVQKLKFKMPMTTWPKKRELKQAGGLYALSTETGYHAYGLTVLTRILGMTSEEAKEICDAAAKANTDPRCKVHSYGYYHVTYGRKPMA